MVTAIMCTAGGQEDARYKVRNNLFFWRPFCEGLINRRIARYKVRANRFLWRPFCEELENIGGCQQVNGKETCSVEATFFVCEKLLEDARYEVRNNLFFWSNFVKS